MKVAEVLIHINSSLSRSCAVHEKMAGIGFGSYGGYFAVIGGIILHLTLGNLYSFGESCTTTLKLLFKFV